MLENKIVYYRINETLKVSVPFGGDVCFKSQFLLLTTNSECLGSSCYRRNVFKRPADNHRKSVIGLESADSAQFILHLRKAHKACRNCIIFKMFV